jgi:lipopolysaccharide biosynthesis regulator YciM
VATLWLLIAAGALVVVVALVFDKYQRRRSQAHAYLESVRSMLSGDPDAAIEALSSAARLHSREAVETYLALGALFRRTGDLARAVRLHRNMLLGPVLDPTVRAEVERELAEDYRRSGMLQEAAEIFGRLAPTDRVAAEGLRDVLAEAGDLAGAADVQRRLGGDGADPLRAHLLAALAREVLPRDPARADRIVREALAADPESADAHLAAAETAGARAEPDGVLAHVAAALEREPQVATLAWPALTALRDPVAALEAVRARVATRPDDAGLHYLSGRLLHLLGRDADALGAFSRALELDRTGEVVLALRDVLREAEPPGPEDLAARHDLLVKALLARARPVRCGCCGAESTTRGWRCRRCGSFDPFRDTARA